MVAVLDEPPYLCVYDTKCPSFQPIKNIKTRQHIASTSSISWRLIFCFPTGQCHYLPRCQSRSVLRYLAQSKARERERESIYFILFLGILMCSLSLPPLLPSPSLSLSPPPPLPPPHTFENTHRKTNAQGLMYKDNNFLHFSKKQLVIFSPYSLCGMESKRTLMKHPPFPPWLHMPQGARDLCQQDQVQMLANVIICTRCEETSSFLLIWKSLLCPTMMGESSHTKK